MPEHIIVDVKNQTLTGIIDFGDVTISDPAYDFTYLRKYGDEFLQEAYKHYSLPHDEKFETRRIFYEKRAPVTNLLHSIKIKDKEKIDLHKKQLSKFIRTELMSS